MDQPLRFEALYYPDRLTVLDETGDIGILTLWTPVKAALTFLEANRIGLQRVAVVANLYGDGLPQMLRNLLWNPQISTLLVFGQDLSGSATEVENLLTQGVESVERLGQPRFRVRGTERYLDTDLDPNTLLGRWRVVRLGKPGPETAAAIRTFFATLPDAQPAQHPRVKVPLREYAPVYFPSEPRSHVISRPSPLEAWKELVFRIMRFGVPHTVSETKKRLELQNVKVVVREPLEETDEQLTPYGFCLADFHAYQRALLSDTLPDDVAYSYGNRLRGYWRRPDGAPIDMLEVAAAKLAASPSGRTAYLSLWDPQYDLIAPDHQSTPCLVSLFFRVFQDSLTLTATFRAHNTMSAWLRNFYGLMAVQRFVAERAGITRLGAITVVSHSISIDPTAVDRLDLAEQIVCARKDDLELNKASGKREFRPDPNGYFTFTTDGDDMVVQHMAAGEVINTYRGRRAEDIETQIARDCAVSLLSHALYVGRELARLQARLEARQAARGA